MIVHCCGCTANPEQECRNRGNIERQITSMPRLIDSKVCAIFSRYILRTVKYIAKAKRKAEKRKKRKLREKEWKKLEMQKQAKEPEDNAVINVLYFMRILD